MKRYSLQNRVHKFTPKTFYEIDPILEMLVMDKHTNLFCSIVSDEEKSFKRGQVNDVKERETNSTDVPPIDI